MDSLKIGDTIINSNSLPYIIAEIGVNHEGSLEKAKEQISLAKEGGASAVKFQTYKAGKIASKDSPSYWNLKNEPTQSQYKLFQKYDSFEEKDYLALHEHSKEVGIDFLSTPFDNEAVDFLSELMPCIKVASADITNIPLLRKVGSKKKLVILSTGASYLSEIETAVYELKNSGAENVALLHCVLNYPTSPEDANLRMIQGLKKTFPEFIIGYSDHVQPDLEMLTLTTAYNYGALIIEKHFTHDKTLPGNDHYHSMDVSDLKKFTSNLEYILKLRGKSIKNPLQGEAVSRENARRSITTSIAIKKGEKLTSENITTKRPGHGISPYAWDDVIGKKSARDLDEDTVLNWSDFE